ncbi:MULTISPECIES: Gfo/Idh/MocA family protein [Pseudoalteromonas]|uniref:Oxidoreductase n=1 Tax=Pseudoalteromonas amylolytica TaxID=1859457 RepID=A0A1S1N0K2_9GAMM|nr:MULTISPECIES: Gfo/Idh/MocA family oxidoreductase [Pseudoalteromonas]OHU90560.1 oxidoreductase [Pseudoalteromonas sp. JW3]OHU92818.1 oxidoreductase [Pseudoalteromonas amylolytica]
MNKVKMGMVGGGQGAFIGAVHRMAAQLDGQIELVCGVFSSEPQCSFEYGQQLGLNESRCYHHFSQMIEQEAQLPEDERMEFLAIVTPNHLHYSMASKAIEYGFHVICDKPATISLAQVLTLARQLASSNVLYALTYTYTGYPMVKEARHRVQSGELGDLRKIIVSYQQGWLADKNSEHQKQAKWRLDPAQAGPSCCMGDIGVHAANLAEYISGTEITHVCSDLTSAHDNRVLDDDGTVLMKFGETLKGVLLASQVATGEDNNLSISIYGDKASLQWQQQTPNTLTLHFPDSSTQVIRSGIANKSKLAIESMRLPAGHPEGYIEAFANIYRNFAAQIRAKKENRQLSESAMDVPGIAEGIRGMLFIDSVVKASKSAQKWHEVKGENLHD